MVRPVIDTNFVEMVNEHPQLMPYLTMYPVSNRVKHYMIDQGYRDMVYALYDGGYEFTDEMADKIAMKEWADLTELLIIRDRTLSDDVVKYLRRHGSEDMNRVLDYYGYAVREPSMYSEDIAHFHGF